MLWFVGERVFLILGRKKVFEIVVAGVMVGGVLHLFTSMVAAVRGYSESYLVGVSGACFALLLASHISSCGQIHVSRLLYRAAKL